MIRVWLFLLTASSIFGQSFNDYDLKPHNYFGAPLKDPMSRFLERLDASGEELQEANGKPLVKRMLDELEIPVTSQVLVFTKTSLQRRAVNPKNPRALYFNEDVYLGWMPNGRIEITSMDPDLGGIFYFQRPLDQTNRPLFYREENCLGCHAGSATNFLPGLLARSVYPDENGRNLKSVVTFDRSGHQVPFNERWGGWYVTGYHGEVRHLGNALASGGRRAPVMETKGNANRESLEDYFDSDLHLRPDSDVLALLLLDHQISMHHWIMEAHYRVRQGLHDAGIEGRSRDDLRKIDDYSRSELESCLDKFMRYLVFADEASLGPETWKGAGAYRENFLANRKTDSKGRSLKDLRMTERIFDYRCSYMIYSKSFQALPGPLKEEIYHRLYRGLVVDGAAAKGFEHLDGDEKIAMAEILRATLPELAAYWETLVAG